MGDRHDYVALEWVKGEIAETLKQARHALEEFVENPEDSTQLRFCLTYVHQVQGTLQMVEFFGAALLAEEMEQLAQALLENRVNNLTEALEVLMQAILQLPLYLDRIQTARRDLPMVVLPLLNDLRAARGEKLLSETSLFTPALPAANAPLSAQRMQQLSAPEVPVLLKKLRQMLQLALVGVFRGQDIATNLGYMARVFARLETLSKNAPQEPLWQVAAGLVDGLANGSVEAGASVRTLLRQVDGELRRLVAEQAEGLNQPGPAELIKNLLFYVAKAQPNSSRLETLHTQYRLAEALPDELFLDEERARMSGPDRGAIRSVVAALCEELVRIKDSLDLFVRSNRENLDELGALQTPLKQIADTLAVLGFAQPRKVVLDQIDVVLALSAGEEEVNDAVLMDIAGALLYIEATLAGMVGDPDDSKNEQNLMPTTDVGHIHRLVIKEARTGLEHAKDGIIEFIASQWNHDNLANVPYLLNQVRGGLAMIPLQRAAALVETCRRYIEEQLFANKVIPDWHNLDTLADAITSVEYYLERLAEDHASQSESILDVAEESLSSLGYAPTIVKDAVADSTGPDRLASAEAEVGSLASDDEFTPELSIEEELNIDMTAEADLVSLDVEPSPVAVEDIPNIDVEWEVSSALETEGLTADSDSVLEPIDSGEDEPALDDSDSEFATFTFDGEASSVELTDIPEVELAQAIVSEAEFKQSAAAEMSLQDVMSSTVAPINPPATDVPPSILPPPADEEPIDEELQEVFVEEAEEVLETLNEFFPQWRADQDDKNALSEVRRAFHTLKGSGRMVRALVAGELAWSVENLLNRVIEGNLAASQPVFAVIAQVMQLFPELVAEYAAQQQRQRDDVDQLAATAHALARNEPVSIFASTADAQQTSEQDVTGDAEFAELNDVIAELAADEEIVLQPLPELITPEPSVDEGAEVIDPVLLDIFKNEAQAHLQTLVEFLADCAQQLPKSINDDLQRAMHTLKGSAFMAGILPIATIATALEKLAKDYKANLLAVEFNEALLLSEAEQLLRVGVEQLDSTPLQTIEGVPALIDKLNQLMSERLGHADEQSIDDPKIISTFLSEGMDTLLDMDEQLERWSTHPAERKELAALLDELTALGHGAEIAELPQIEDLCSALLELYTAVKNGRLPTQERFFAHAKQAHDALINMMDQVAAGLQVEPRQDSVDALYALLSDELQPLVIGETEAVREPSAEPQLPELSVEPELIDVAQVLPEASVVTGPELEVLHPAGGSLEDEFSLADLDEEMVEIFLEEAMDLLESAGESLEVWLSAPQNNTVMSALLRDLHTLKGGARMSEIKPVGDLAHELESLYEGLLDGRYSHSHALADLLLRSHDRLAVSLDQLQAGQTMQQPTRLIESMQAFRRGEIASLIEADADDDADLQVGFLDSAADPAQADLEDTVQPEQDAITDTAVTLDSPLTVQADDAESGFDEAAADIAITETDTLTDEVLLAEQAEPGLAPADVTGTETAAELRDPELVEIFLEEGFEIIDSASAALLRWIANSDNVLELETLQRDLHTLKGGARMAEIAEIGDLAHELEFLYEDLSAGKLKVSTPVFSLLQDCHDSLAMMLEAVQNNTILPDGLACIGRIQQLRGAQNVQQVIPESIELQPVSDSVDIDDNDDILSIFIAEANELLAELDAALGLCVTADATKQPVDDALRALRTLKGGAQLADAQVIGDISQQFEEQLLKVVQHGQPWSNQVQSQLHSAFEQLVAAVATLGQSLPEHLLLQEYKQFSQEASVPTQKTQWATPIVAVSTLLDKQIVHKTLPFVEKAKQNAARTNTQRTSQEQVRVPADLLEELVNLAGETSIFRGRVEQQISDFGFTLSEMEATIDRVRDQLRRLDTETQAQILSRYQAETEKAGYEDFDPLEMDRYSQLQQLSRALFESSSDLLDLKETLVARSRDAETLLLQQARVNTELQEGLMRTRMVPFERLLPRLRRVVRQVSNELGKDIDFIVGNAEGEVDRSVLERMLAPLEHMLRNAIDHGIESAEVRRAAGKSEDGTIRLELSREGADILLVLSDDGAGVNLEAVRNKAIERGLISANTVLTDQEMLQFILHAGISTAGKVTQISGRGVGMDVVSAEIKQIGGSIHIDSQPGIGTRFNIRLPFTVSVNRALMVMAGEDSYAIPLNTIEGIVRISPYELEALYQQEQQEGKPARFEYAGQDYQLKYIGDLLNNGQSPKLVGQSLPLPVILVRSNEYAVAVQVDVLAGSREIVVKSLGPQFASVHGISGATILGDGRVVVILDLMATIRLQQASASLAGAVEQSSLPAAADRQVAKLVMIVDDSVTVRKVTSRLLERNGMQVMTAKDGVDAITQLQERRPDIMLLDIEMPRMDGFEVANLVRHDSRLKDLPIIMITSRTGEKHRERAMAIGVNDYLGKPYQETVLLEAISRLLGRHD
jgi:chemosensory pili system protein ChpA (sensor histidine kinase/response regulator)